MTEAGRSRIRVKAMLIAPNDDLTAHAVSLLPPTKENPHGYHRLVGGSVELGESHRDAIVREIQEELGASIGNLRFLATVEDIFRYDGTLCHHIVFLYTGRLHPSPPLSDGFLTEADGSVVPVVWRPISDELESIPLYPRTSAGWARSIVDRLPSG